MKTIIAAAAALALPALALAQDAPAEETLPHTPAMGPSDIVNAAPKDDWVAVAAEDLLVMTLAPDRDGKPRQVMIQLMPAPFSQGWVENIRTLARAEWYDGISVNRVQDNYVVQWGDPGYDNPESGDVETKALPDGLKVMVEEDYSVPIKWYSFDEEIGHTLSPSLSISLVGGFASEIASVLTQRFEGYPFRTGFFSGWPVAGKFDYIPRSQPSEAWPVHCYGMVGVGRNYSPDTGSGAELYTVIGHAPRHLDRNIALVGRIISGMEHLSSLPRGSGALGFYAEEEKGKRTPILSIRVASGLPEDEKPQFEYLSTDTKTFAAYAEARANRRDPFFIVPAGGADICNIPVPVRTVDTAE